MNDNARKLVEVLRSGEYTQTKGVLKRNLGERNGEAVHGHCCLGVAAEEYIKAGGELPEWFSMEEEGKLPACVMDFYGFTDRGGAFNGSDGTPYVNPHAFWDHVPHTLVGRNDAGLTFEQIADIIESEPKGLFRDDA